MLEIDGGNRLRDGRRKGRHRVRENIRRALRGHERLFQALNRVARVPPRASRELEAYGEPSRLIGAQAAKWKAGSDAVLHLLENVVLELIRGRGDRASALAAMEEALAVLFRLRPEADAERGDALGLLLALWAAPDETLQRLRHCDFESCEAPYFLDETASKTSKHCSKKHGTYASRLALRFERDAPAIRSSRRSCQCGVALYPARVRAAEAAAPDLEPYRCPKGRGWHLRPRNPV